MNRDDIIKMAESCGIPEYENNESQAENIIRFFHMAQAAEREALEKNFAVVFESVRAWEDWCKAIRENEREACAKVADQISNKYGWGYYGNEVDTADEIATAIRARGQA